MGLSLVEQAVRTERRVTKCDRRGHKNNCVELTCNEGQRKRKTTRLLTFRYRRGPFHKQSGGTVKKIGFRNTPGALGKVHLRRLK